MMTNPADATQVDIAEKENAPSPAVKASPKPAANVDGSSKFVNVDGKVKHRRVVKADGVDAMTHAAATVGAEQEPMNDYERQRDVRDPPILRHETPRASRPFRSNRADPALTLVNTPSLSSLSTQERIRRNNERLRALKVLDTAKALEISADAASNAASNVVKRTPSSRGSRKPKAPPPPPRAKSRRLAVAANADAALAAKLQAAEDSHGGLIDSLDDSYDDDDATPAHLTCEEWCEKRGIVPGPKMDGRFRGWVAPDLVESLGLASSAAEAWESNGGGSFAKAGKAGKGENAKEFARKMIKKNPNCYFYRHNAPGQDAWHGDWAEDEIQRFVQVAKEHGCGDKWGLFASYIPHRVGYQCSAAYRHVIIPRGLLLDDQFVMSRSGEAIYVGKKGSKGSA